jgi:hypothetical protein
MARNPAHPWKVGLQLVGLLCLQTPLQTALVLGFLCSITWLMGAIHPRRNAPQRGRAHQAGDPAQDLPPWQPIPTTS